MKKFLAIILTLISCAPLMSNDMSWSFPPVTLSTANINASDAHIATDANGNLTAVWVENGFVKSSAQPVNGNWSTAVTISGASASSPRIVADPNGNAGAVWLEGTTVKGATKPFNGNWTSSTALSSTGAATPDIAVDAAGDLVAVWARSGNVESSTKLFGAGWQTHVTITSASAAMPKVAIGGTGSSRTAAVVWYGVASGTNVVYSSTKLITGSWSAELALSCTGSNAAYPHVAVNSNGLASAVWYSYNVSGSIYYDVRLESASMVTSSSWTAPVALSQPGIVNPANLASCIGFDATGNAVALWNNSYDGATYTIQSSVLPVRGDWQAPQTLLDSNLYGLSANMAVSSLGDALAGYMFYNGTSLLVQAAELNTSGFTSSGWSVPINLSVGTDNGYPKVAATLTGNVINAAAIWINNNGVNNSIQTVRGKRSVVLPPSNLSVTQHTNNFGIFTEYYNTVSWTASSDPKVAGYVIFRNGVFFEQVAGNVIQIVDDNQPQNGAVIYGVAAIDSQNSQSNIITKSFP